ncbi:MAG: hypothetical protein LBF16_00065 [Pseudomonadales bacterium]|nr:hypothetical protein [Pseudomonadales bacterium]
MRAMIGALVLLWVFSSGCSSRAISEGTLLPSELAKRPEKYDGKHVDVRGYVVIGPERRNIFDSKKGYQDPHGACLGLDGSDTMFGNFHSQNTRKISGVFRQSLCGKNDVCLYWCSEYGIELDQGSKP